MTVDYLLSTDMLIMIAAFAGSGVIRGFSGGAGANFLTAPVLAAMIGPREAVPVILLLNGVTNIQMIPGAIRHVNWRAILPLAAASVVTMPLGAWALFAIDEDTMRRAVAGAAVVFALVLLTGWRYRGRRGTGASIAAGSAGGVLAGAVSMGGPPVFLYLMSGSGDAATNRAHFITFAVFVQLAAIAVFFGAGAYSARMLWLSLVLLVPYVIAIWIGTRLFHAASEQTFRRVTLWGMVLVSVAIVLL